MEAIKRDISLFRHARKINSEAEIKIRSLELVDALFKEVDIDIDNFDIKDPAELKDIRDNLTNISNYLQVYESLAMSPQAEEYENSILSCFDNISSHWHLLCRNQSE
jgi:hypothetical protein